MKFTKIEILESRKDSTTYLGILNGSKAILTGLKNLPNEIELKIELPNKQSDSDSINIDSDSNFKQEGITSLYYPATPEIIDAYKNKIKIVTETYKQYIEKVEPYINSILDSNTKWVKNILYNKSEKERVVSKNKKFIVIKNIGFDTNNDFYILIIPFEPIKHIRDLNVSHRELLETMKKKGLDVAKKYNYEENELYFFFHYHPSCYHLHLHVCLMNHKSLKFRIYRHVLLDYVLDNLEIIVKKDMKFEIAISNPIYKLLSE